MYSRESSHANSRETGEARAVAHLRFFSLAVVAAVALVLVGCASAGTSSVDQQTSSPTQASLVPSASSTTADLGRAKAEAACVTLQKKNFVEPGVAETITIAGQLATEAAQADPQWQPLAQAIASMLSHYGSQAHIDEFNADLKTTYESCKALGVIIVTD